MRLDLEEHEMEAVLEELRAEMTAVPGMQITIGQPIGHRIDHMLSGTRANIAINLFGPDLYELRRIATRIGAVAQSVEGTADVAVEQQADVPQVRVAMNRPAMARYGVTPDLITFAKGITNAAVPMAGVMASKKIYDAFMTGPEHVVELFHGYTYSGHPLAAAAALATLDIYKDEGLFERAKALEPVFAEAMMKGAVHRPSSDRTTHPRSAGCRVEASAVRSGLRE